MTLEKLKKTLCLVVDDSEVDLLIGQAIAMELGMEVKGFLTAEEAISFCKTRMPRVIILDNFMPGLSGVEFIKQLRKEKKGDKPYIVMYSASSDPALINEALNSGANGFITKPLMAKILEEKLSEA